MGYFPNINGVPPYKNKHQVPYYEVNVTDTPYSVRTVGPLVSYFTFATYYGAAPPLDATHRRWTGSVPLVKLQTGKFFPAEISEYYNKHEQFAIQYTGVYIPKVTGSATFHFMGNGFVGGDFVTPTVQLSVYERKSVLMSGLTKGERDISNMQTINYISLGKSSNNSNVFVTTVKDTSYDKPIILANANYPNPFDILVNPPQPLSVSNILNIKLSINDKQVSEFEFSIPVVSTTASVGWKYVKYNNYFENVQDSTKKIKQFNMIEYNTGYKYPSGTLATIRRFTGQVRSWNVNRDSSGKSVAQIKCQDWGVFLQDAINEGYPNISDYLAFDYLDEIDLGGVNGKSKPRTYDGWRLEDVIDSLMINAGIDPSVLHANRKYINVDGDIVEGYKEFQEREANSKIFLDKTFSYGRPLAIAGESEDDKYLNQFSIGDSLYDNVQTIMDSFGLAYGFNNEGNFYSRSMKNPLKVKTIDEITADSDWNESLGVDKIAGVSYTTATNTAKINGTFIGKGCKITFDVSPSYGTIHIRLANGTVGLVATSDYSLSHTTARSFYNGDDDSVGYNPCILSVGTGLDYGFYSLQVTNITTKRVTFNSMLVYDYDYNYPVEKFYTGDFDGEVGVVTDRLQATSNADNIRNDVIVVGRLKGFDTSLSLDENQQQMELIKNPNNPLANHILARVQDRVSIGSISNQNYIGRKLQTVIIEPSIGTEERADWLATEFIRRYNDPKKTLSSNISIVGNPLLNLDDLINIKDVNTDIIGTIHKFWIKNVTEQHSENGYKTTLTLDSFEPWESFYRYPTPLLSRIDNSPFVNLLYYNTALPIIDDGLGIRTEFVTELVAGTKIRAAFRGNIGNLSVSDMERIVPEKGYIKIGKEVIRYGSRTFILSGSNILIDYANLERGKYNTAQYDHSAAISPRETNKVMVPCFNPYITGEEGIFPYVSFDLLFPGFVRVSVKDASNRVVDVITGDGKFTIDGGWEFLRPGTYQFQWGLLDRLGEHNSTNSGQFQYAGSDSIGLDGGVDYPWVIPGIPQDENTVTALGRFFSHYGIGKRSGASYSIIPPYKIGKGYYVVNDKYERHAEFRFILEYIDHRQEFFKTVVTKKQHNKIYTSVFNTGDKVETNKLIGVHEEVNIQDEPDVVFIGAQTDWWNNDIKANIDRVPPSIFYRQYYNGTENNGRGLGIELTNVSIADRWCQVKLFRRKLYLLKMKYYGYWNGSFPGWDEFGAYPRLHSGEELVFDSSTHGFKLSNTANTIYVPSAPGNFITPEIERIFHDSSNKGLWTKVRVLGAFLSCMHILKFVLTDWSGRKSVKYVTIWYIDPLYDLHEADFQGAMPTNRYDPGNIHPNDKWLLAGFPTGTSYVDTFLRDTDVPTGVTIKHVLVRRNPGGQHPHYSIPENGIFGIRIFEK